MASFSFEQIVFGDMDEGRRQTLEATEEAGHLDDETRDSINQTFDQLSSFQRELLEGLDLSKIRAGLNSFPKDKKTFNIDSVECAENYLHYSKCMIRFYKGQHSEQVSGWRDLEGASIKFLDQFRNRHSIKVNDEGVAEFFVHGTGTGVKLA